MTVVLSRNEIKKRLALPVSDAKSLIITPLLDEEGALSSTDAIDLRLGTHFLLPQAPPALFGGLGSDASLQRHLRVHVPLGGFLVVQAHQTVLGATLEFIKLPLDVSGQILTKSSVARTFVVIETAPWVHPCYRGCLTLEIANVSNTALILHPGLLIGQLVLLRVADPVREERLSGSYLGPVHPEAPALNKVTATLGSIGVRKDGIRIPRIDTAVD